MRHHYDGGPAFPFAAVFAPDGTGYSDGAPGMSLRDYFAIHAPEPTKEQIEQVGERERLANPHGDTYKPRRRGWTEIACSLRYEWADAMLAARATGEVD